MLEHAEILKRVPLFSELTHEELTKLSQITSEKTIGKKQFIFMEGEKREAVYFIRSGVVKVFRVDENGNEQVINLLQTGEMFPHIGFFDEGPYPSTAQAMEETHLLVIRVDDFNELLMMYPRIAIKVMKIMGQKIKQLANRIQEFISQDVQHRLIHTLLRLSDQHLAEDGSATIEMPLTNQDVANMVGTTRETINRIFNQLKKEGLIETSRKRIYIPNVDALKEHIES
ncbi:Crp/Fnr family transcriptional regulator [Tuberibacillus calidus]|jgi:CRP/FNR family transcriptional regulator|uniref:Crp/Fnr family transcriptional regulator n=1 Tax=Tuberibacillus calidus TaxID=340097 RepID=UPI00041CF110|nr:Crp/Fnr family transcriptional regulator [Tuberibacillus calidus]